MPDPATSPPATRRGFAVVDVETTGLDPSKHRVIEVAVTQVSPDGEVEQAWSSLVFTWGSTGPVHIHGLTRAMLFDAPTFAEVMPTLRQLLDGRILVAHNAAFDWLFLATEAARARSALPVEERLCTVNLARALAIPATNLKLSTLADHWGIDPGRSHRAADDVATLVQVLVRCLDESGRQSAPLPLEACSPAHVRRRHPAVLNSVAHLAPRVHRARHYSAHLLRRIQHRSHH